MGQISTIFTLFKKRSEVFLFDVLSRPEIVLQ